jgi:hypothetical protein
MLGVHSPSTVGNGHAHRRHGRELRRHQIAGHAQRRRVLLLVLAAAGAPECVRHEAQCSFPGGAALVGELALI